MNVKLIAFDLDGTLLDSEKHLPPENLAALRAAYDMGIVLVPATGRILKAIPDELMAPGLFRYFIFANGAEPSGCANTWTLSRSCTTATAANEAI